MDHYIKATYVRRDGHRGKNMGEKPQKMKQHNEVCQETFKRSGDRKQHMKAHIPVCVSVWDKTVVKPHNCAWSRESYFLPAWGKSPFYVQTC